MRVVFADSGYWIAVSNPRDALHRLAVDARSRLAAHRIVTSELVLIEVLNCFSGDGPRMRGTVAGLVQRIIDNERIDLVLHTRELFRDALALYRDRADKDWSLTDRASFLIMERRQITEALTYDRHFEQYGYRALLRD